MKFLFLFLVSVSAFAQTGKISGSPLMSDVEGGELLASLSEGETKRFVFHSGFKSLYTNGDYVILWGIGPEEKNQDMTKTEYQGLWRIMNYLSSNGFRVVMNFRATGEDLRLAAASSATSAILFSGHGNVEGFYDFEGKKVDYKVFEKASPTVYQFVLSACHGRQALNDYYVVPKTMKTLAWDDFTNSTQLINYLAGDNWSVFDGKPAKK